MSNPFQEQLLKAGVVTKQQVQKANQAKNKKKKQQRAKKGNTVDESTLKAQQVQKEKARLDRELNKKKEEQAQQKAISVEINQLITQNSVSRDDTCDIAYNFEHNNKVNRIYVSEDMKQQIIKGRYGIARINGRYELVPSTIAEKILQRNNKRVILFKENNQQKTDSNDPYADYQVPDDLTW